jgi:hypothetical protein
MISIRSIFAFIVIFPLIEFRGNLSAWGPNR